MRQPPYGNRRAMLRTMGAALAGAACSILLPGASLVQASVGVPGPLRVLASRETCRHARRRVQVRPCAWSAVQTAKAYIRAPADAVARSRFEQQSRQDVVVGRISVLRGWVVAETELALLSMVKC